MRATRGLALLAIVAVLGCSALTACAPGSAAPSVSASPATAASAAFLSRSSASASASAPARPTASASSGASAPPSAAASSRPSASFAASATPSTTGSARTPTSASATLPPTASPGATAPTASATPRPAPSSAAGFQPRKTVVPIGFPLPATAAYRYGDAWRVPRLGVVYRYNQIRGVTSRGVLLRAHDGVDLPVANGTRVLAPFTGVVVDPATIWKPWDPQRYGTVVVVRSTEAASRGYLALMAHLSRRDVRVGDRIRRGAVVGRTGQTGNAGGTPPHLHFELRAPFTIPYAYAGVRRNLDVFDPLPSLLESDPKRT